MIRALALLPLLVACSQDTGLKKVGDAAGAEGPDIEVSPGELTFGSLSAGESVTKTFTVSNVGPEDSTLEVSGITIGGEARGFTILTPAEDLVFNLPGGTSTDIDVAFSPDGANSQVAEAVVVSDDDDEARVTVDLLGEGRVPELQIDPDPLDLGTAYIGCDATENVTLTNVGTDTLIIESIAHSGGVFTLDDPNVLPLELEPEASTEVHVTFTPLVEGAEVGELSVVSNEPRGTRVSEQTGEGRYAAEYEDVFDVAGGMPVDILFFVDQSCSMDDDTRALGENFSAFIADLSVYTTDWQIIVTNDDDGCKDTAILTEDFPSYERQFSEYVNRGGGGFSLYTEAGLTIADLAIQQTDSTRDCNYGFLRPSAMLHIIMVSDEPEQSSRTYDYYVNRIIAKKGDASLVKFSAVAGDVPGGCSSGGNSAEAGTGYVDAVRATGGEYLSICSNWSTSVEALATASVSAFTFTLTRTPVPSTIVVAVNGSERAGGWSYDSGSNSIVFEESRRPEEGDVVTVNYAGLASCE